MTPTAQHIPPELPPLQALGARLRAHRKALRVSSTATAEAAGISRVTLHRIEKGEPSVAVGAWVSVLTALGLKLEVKAADETGEPTGAHAASADWIPARIRLANYPQLKALTWQVQGTDTLTPLEALDIYERNARHLDPPNMSPEESALLQALRTGLGHHAPGGHGGV